MDLRMEFQALAPCALPLQSALSLPPLSSNNEGLAMLSLLLGLSGRETLCNICARVLPAVSGSTLRHPKGQL
eukprot:365978-Chlamydomonas_euryale.AAC.3